jgi:phosphopantothenoylcysteine synthetase/decarboxylase
MNTRKIINSGLAALIIAGSLIGCASRRLETLKQPNNSTEMQTHEKQAEDFSFGKAYEILTTHPEDYSSYLENCKREK